MRVKSKVYKNYDMIATNSDVVELLKLIKGVAFNFETQKNAYQSIHEVMWKYWVAHQGKSETVQEYHNKFVN
jgi:hypothetical protein